MSNNFVLDFSRFVSGKVSCPYCDNPLHLDISSSSEEMSYSCDEDNFAVKNYYSNTCIKFIATCEKNNSYELNHIFKLYTRLEDNNFDLTSIKFSFDLNDKIIDYFLTFKYNKIIFNFELGYKNIEGECSYEDVPVWFDKDVKQNILTYLTFA